VRNFLRLLRRRRQVDEAPSTAATRDDVAYCYRLLLGRQPDAEGWRYYTELVDKGDLSVERLVGSFTDSHEYRTRRATEHQAVAVALDGIRLYVRHDDKEVGAPLAEAGRYEPHVTAELRPLLRDDTVFVDVGANIGYFTILAASLVRQGKVIAFEPNRDNCALIRMSLDANGLGNVTLHPFAVSDTGAEFALDVVGSNGALREASPTDDLIVRSVVFDDCVSKEPRVDIIKMDIEGFEGRALRGMTQTIARHRPVLFSELLPDGLVRRSRMAPHDYLMQIVQLGYDLFALPFAGGRSSMPQTPAEILDAYSRAHASHIDVVAYPH
jgi:FkbM family methyltransferase